MCIDQATTKLRILLVGTHLDSIILTKRILEMKGYSVVATADSIADAIAIVRDQPVDLLISLSRVYPFADARDMLRELRAMGWNGRAILTTANSYEEDLVADCKRVGFAQVLGKPVRVEVLLAAINATDTPASP